MTSYLLIRHKVKDFAGWKPAYEDDLPKRNEAGLTEKIILRGISDKNEIIVLFECRDLERARKFVESTDLKDAMKKAGVIDKPDIYFLTEEKAGVYAKASGF